MTENTITPWIMAARPKTLVATVAPIAMGAALALGDGRFSVVNFVMALLSALCIQIGTNLANDYFDFKKGADTVDRVGPKRMTQAGLIKSEQVMLGFVLSFALAALFGLYLVFHAGIWILIVGAASILSGLAYTSGPWPLAYVGLGELFVLIFFGPVASGFTYFVVSERMDAVAFIVGLCPGAISCAILVANNLRDVEQDKKAKKLTLAVRFGLRFAKFEYAAAWVLAFVVLITCAYLKQRGTWILPLAIIPLALRLSVQVFRAQSPQELIDVLEGTAKGLGIFATLFCMGTLL